jgi:hypothetical protein
MIERERERTLALDKLLEGALGEGVKLGLAVELLEQEEHVSMTAWWSPRETGV